MLVSLVSVWLIVFVSVSILKNSFVLFGCVCVFCWFGFVLVLCACFVCLLFCYLSVGWLFVFGLVVCFVLFG